MGRDRAQIYIGTSGYDYKEWLGSFYPEGTKRKEFLSYYTRHFPLVEINNTFYRLPAISSMEKMISQTPNGFLFSLKGHNSFTHNISDTWKQNVSEFVQNIDPLLEAKKLVSILLQFPYSFHYTDRNRTYLSKLCDQLSDLPVCIEFRNRDWDLPRVYSEMRMRRLGIVCTDSPHLKGLPRPEARFTSDIGYIRFHGRNASTWWDGNNVSRYDYLYKEEELKEWIPRINILVESTKVVLIAFNNHFRGNAVKNALQLNQMLAR